MVRADTYITNGLASDRIVVALHRAVDDCNRLGAGRVRSARVSGEFELMSSSAFKGADVSDRLDRAIDNALADNRLVGTVVIVARGGKIAYRRAAGFADRESQKPMQTDSIFRFASVTKPFVTAAVMRLIEDGVVRLDDPVTRFLPDFQPRLSDGSVPVISIRHLLTHTSGLGYP
ncbi:hypothetical protein KXX17_000347, partial [Aspergillus fumigatus]